MKWRSSPPVNAPPFILSSCSSYEASFQEVRWSKVCTPFAATLMFMVFLYSGIIHTRSNCLLLILLPPHPQAFMSSPQWNRRLTTLHLFSFFISICRAVLIRESYLLHYNLVGLVAISSLLKLFDDKIKQCLIHKRQYKIK